MGITIIATSEYAPVQYSTSKQLFVLTICNDGIALHAAWEVVGMVGASYAFQQSHLVLSTVFAAEAAGMQLCQARTIWQACRCSHELELHSFHKTSLRTLCSHTNAKPGGMTGRYHCGISAFILRPSSLHG